jgi:hypothetical protein
MKSALLVVSLMLAIIYGQLLLAQSSKTTSADVEELDGKDPQAKEAKALQETKQSSGPKPEPSILTKQQKQSADSISYKKALSNKKGPSKNQGPSKVFIPTEEISEDKPVAFPVDI